MTLTLIASDVHHISGQSDVYGAIAVAVVIMLLSFALDGVRGLVSALWGMSKLLFKAVGVAIALCAALVVLVGVVVLSTAGG